MNLFSPNITRSLLLYMTIITTTTLQAESNFVKNIAHFADEHDPHNRLITVDYKNMKLLQTEHVEGSLNHHADSMATRPSQAKYIMMVAKGSNFVTIRRTKDGSFVKKISLPFRPRSADAYNAKYNLVLLNSRDRPSAVLIDATKLKIVGQAGFNITCNKPNIIAPFTGLYSEEDIPNLQCMTNDAGGDQISGHPIWISTEAFVILDRSNRLLHVYSIYQADGEWKTKLEQTIKTDTSLHQIIPRTKRKRNRIFYGETEGNLAQNKSAGVYKWVLRRDGKGLKQKAFTKLNIKDKQGFNGHNLYITPNKRFIYAPVGSTINQDFLKKSSLSKNPSENNLCPPTVGCRGATFGTSPLSTNARTATQQDIGVTPQRGGIFVLRSRDLRIVKFIEAGFGAGHVNFSKRKGMAIVTNHKDTFVTAINYRRNHKIKDIKVNFKHENIFSLNQSHAPFINRNGKYFYNFWTDGGVFFRINLNRLKVDKAVYVGGVPIQGNYYRRINQND